MKRPKLPRWLTPRFSLRTLFMLVTVAGLSTWWVNSQLNWIRHRHAADSQFGYPHFVSIIAREELHRTNNKSLPWGLRLFGEDAVPMLHCNPASELKVGDLRKLFPEADIIEIYYPSYPDEKPRQLASTMIGTYTIETTDGAQVLMWTGVEGSKAVLLFPTHEAATDFLAGIKVAEMHVIQLTPENIRQWAAKVRGFGAQEAILNPSPDGSLTERSVAQLDAVMRVILGNAENN